LDLPFSPSADRNKEPILSVLTRELSGSKIVLEIGSGTGQHACFFAGALTDIVWQPTELAENITGITRRINLSGLTNVSEPVVLDVNNQTWPINNADVCFTCNTFHIVSIDSVRSIFKGCASVLGDAGKLCVYGPFTIDGKHVSPSNIDFDQWLRDSDPNSGVRDLSELDEIALSFGYTTCRRIEMPANNFIVVWEIA